MAITSERREEAPQEGPAPEVSPAFANGPDDPGSGYVVLPIPAFVDLVARRLEASFDAKLAAARFEITKEIITARDELSTDIRALSDKTGTAIQAQSEKTKALSDKVDARFNALSDRTDAQFDTLSGRTKLAIQA